jgi:hypothetical protein
MTEPEPEPIFVPEDSLDPDEREPEASPVDIAEQATPADPADEPEEIHRGLEVDEYDAIEQSRVVNHDEEGARGEDY